MTAAFLCPASAVAEGRVAHSVAADGTETDYATVNEAVAAGLADKDDADTKAIIMDVDWTFDDGCITVGENQKFTIDMHGHRITTSDNGSEYSIFDLKKGSELTLTSSKRAYFAYRGYCGTSASQVDADATAGGLIMGSKSCGGTPFEVGESATLNLDGVVVGGSNVYSGAVFLSSDAKLNMTNGAAVAHNGSSSNGAGIYMSGDRVTVNMSASSVSDNYSSARGGGILMYGKGGAVNMNNGSQVDSNGAKAGGGIYCYSSTFTIKSDDGTAYISDNLAFSSSKSEFDGLQSGGGIHVDQCKYETNKGLIEGITISDNYSAYDGGGIELDQENTTIKNCIIKGNSCRYEGGGIYVYNDKNVIDGCTIRGNTCNGEGGNYEGGGVYVPYSYDIKMIGKCVVKANQRGSKTDVVDDVFLDENVGDTIEAYITGGVSKGSKVGVRTGTTGDRMIGKNIKNEGSNCFFADLDDYYVSYGDDHGGDMWQRHAAKEYELKLNGTKVGTFKSGEQVALNGAPSDSSVAFKRWSEDVSVGLDPFADYVGNGKTAAVSFKMPQNDVNLVGEYINRAQALTITVNKPKGGQDLLRESTVSWTDPVTGEEHSYNGASVSWYEVSSGRYSLATGKAKFNTRYAADLSISQNDDLAFALDLAADDVKFTFSDGEALGTASARVDGGGKVLYTTSGEYRTPQPEVTSVEEPSITVQEGATEDELRALLPEKATATTETGATVQLSLKRDKVDFGELVVDGKVVDCGSVVSVSAPLAGDSSVNLPSRYSSTRVNVTVSKVPVVSVAEPELDPTGGVYSTVDDKAALSDGVLKVKASCKTERASIEYKLRYRDGDGEWTEPSAAAWPSGGLELKVKAGVRRTYSVESWAVLDGAESSHRTASYVIDDSSSVCTAKVTVNYEDTAVDGHHGKKDSESFEVNKGATASLAAPYREGYAFEKWTLDGKDLGDDPTLTFESIASDTTVTAVYNPVVTELDADIEAPQAHATLAKTAQVKAVAGDSKTAFDVTSYFSGASGAKVSWSPESTADGKAAHMTNYTASLSLAAEATASNAKYVLSPLLSVTYKGHVIEGSAYYVAGDDPRLCIEFPNTGPYEFSEVKKPADVELSFQRASSYQSEQNKGKAASWGLPETVKVAYRCGEVADLPVVWESVSGFDARASSAQALVVHGKVSWPEDVDNDGAPEYVECTIKVAASSQDQDGDEERNENLSTLGSGSTSKTTVAVETKKRTSDARVLADTSDDDVVIAACGALGVLVAAAGIVTSERKKR